MKAEVAIIGNGVAGYACAARLARHGIRPLLIGPGLPVDRPPLTKKALASGVPTLLSDEQRLAERGIDRLDGVVAECDLDRRWIGLDALLLVFSLAICVALFGSGGAEALIGAIAGALSGRRQASRNVVSSAFAGLFAGALFAGFFHGTLAALF